MININLAALAVSLVLVSNIAFGQSVPHVFQSGTPARASEVNENFDAVGNAVSDNISRIAAAEADLATQATSLTTQAASIAAHATSIAENTVSIQANQLDITALVASSGVQVYSQGTSIGRFIGFEGFGTAWILSDQGYLYRIGMTGDQGYLEVIRYFADAGCSGAMYMNERDWTVAQGAVFSGGELRVSPAPIFYTQQGSVAQIRAYSSIDVLDDCHEEVGARLLHEVFPNDVATTGVPDTPFARPLQIGVP